MQSPVNEGRQGAPVQRSSRVLAKYVQEGSFVHECRQKRMAKEAGRVRWSSTRVRGERSGMAEDCGKASEEGCAVLEVDTGCRHWLGG
jgi:hypothetical protein